MANNKNDVLDDYHSYSSSLKTREIFLHNHYHDSENPGVEYKMASVFIKNLRALEQHSTKDIIVHLYSIGGEWNDCMAIYDIIKASYCNIGMISYGQTESSSTIILQAAATRVLMPSSYFMVHYGSSYYSGDYQNVHNWSEFEKKFITETMMNIYAEKCQYGLYFQEKDYTTDQVKKFLYKKLKDGDWYMTPEEAVYYGFADGVLGSMEYPDINSINTS